jgi:hypothetical protein
VGRRTVGPGYVSRADALSGTRLVDDLRDAGPLNDPRYGGLGAFAWHHARGRPGRIRFGARNAWEVSGRDCAGANEGFGVARARVVRRPRAADGVPVLVTDVFLADRFTYPEPLLRVRYAYAVRPERLDARITVTSLCDLGRCGRTRLRAFVKEPKIVASLTGGRASRTATFDDAGRLVCQYAGAGPPEGPVLRTGQCAAYRRMRVRFDLGSPGTGAEGGCDLADCLEVEVRGDDGLWEGSGLDIWALAAAERPAARRSDTASLDGVVWDCHEASPAADVHRRWETVARRDPTAGDGAGRLAVSVLFPAWEGGRGGYDCEPLSRLFGPHGESYTVRVTYRIV